MKKIICRLMVLIAMMAVISCSEEDGCEFEAVDLNVQGVELTQKNTYMFYGTLPQNGGTVTFEAKGKNASQGFPTQIQCGDYQWNVSQTENAQVAPYTLCDQSWGAVRVVSSSPYTTELVFTANETRTSRQITILFGGEPTLSYVTLTQPSALLMNEGK